MLSRLKTFAGSRSPTLHIRREDDSSGHAWQFSEPFRIGRGEECEVSIANAQVSRLHASVAYSEEAWWIVDEQSTNGLYVDGERVERARLGGKTSVRLGREGPALVVQVEAVKGPALPVKVAAARPPSDSSSEKTPVGVLPQTHASAEATMREEEPSDDGPADPNVSWYVRRYFSEGEDGPPMGERTRYIRQAYQQVQRKQKRLFTGVLASVAVLLVVVGAYAAYQHVQNQRLERAAAELFYEMKEQDVRLAQLAGIVEETGGEELSQLLSEMQEARQRMAQQYEGYVRELGVYRRLNEEERVIYRMARIFGESEFEIPAGFVREVRREIHDYWLASGRSRFINAVQTAEENGYTPVIVQTLQEQGLPPELYYLALQESNFDVNAVGPETRWGIAKGMWQFIPTTARAYGLRTGPREDTRIADPQDERHDFEKATAAAARYKAEIYSTLAQASGLLVMASYNWGEHRVVGRLNELFEGIPQNPRERSYWRFFQEYEDRMPQETKDYVLRIFAASVIGENPRLFGLEMDNPLQPYLEETPELRAEGE